MSTTFNREEVEVRSADPQLYRLRNIELPEWYVAERIAEFSRLASKDEAMQRTEEWWLSNLSYDWEEHFTLEKVED